MNQKRTLAWILSGVFVVALVAAAMLTSAPPSVEAQSQASGATHPDFSGVYRPVNPFGNFGAKGKGDGAKAKAKAKGKAKGGPPPRPTQSAPLSDGSQGRSPNAPKLTPEYLAKWEMISESRIAGSYEYDLSAHCLPPGMPAMMNMAYGMEVMQNDQKITFFSELNDALRRVYLDGRQPSPEVLEDPTYAGYSTGHWEGDTLVVDTVALRDNTFIEGFTPHSDQMTVHERIRLIDADTLEDQITVTDPVALTEPWSTVKTYRRAGPGDDELREFACAEGLELPEF